MMRSLQLRLGVSLALGLIVLWSAATVVSSLVVRHETNEIHDFAIVQAARQQRAFSGNDDGSAPRADDRQLPVDDDSLDYRRQALRESVAALVAPVPVFVPLSLRNLIENALKQFREARPSRSCWTAIATTSA